MNPSSTQCHLYVSCMAQHPSTHPMYHTGISSEDCEGWVKTHLAHECSAHLLLYNAVESLVLVMQCCLLEAAYSFNYTSDVIQLLIPSLIYR